MNKFLKLAINEINNHTFDDCLNFHLCAIIVGGGSVLSIGFNKMSRNSFVQHLSVDPSYNKPFINKHAELDAILRARNKIDLSGCKIYVARIKRLYKEIGMARPCVVCQNALFRYGIKRAYYTIDQENYGILTIKPNGQTSDKIISIGNSYVE